MDTAKLQNIEFLALTLMAKHNLRNWVFKFDNAKSRRGQCDHRDKTISLSKPLTEIANESEIRNTLLHEIAHAIVGASHKHNNVWKRKAIEIGCNGKRCSVRQNEVKRKFKGICPNCQYTVRRHRRTKIACVRCCNKFNYGKYDEKYLFQWSMNRD